MSTSRRHGLTDLLATLFDRTAREGKVNAPPLVGEPFARLAADLEALGVPLYDLRDRPRSGRGAAHGTRKITNVTAILWHQMAAIIDDPERCLNIPCHGAVLRSGGVVLCHDLLAYLYHANTANKFTIGIEISARADGVEGNPLTFWRSSDEINGYTDRRGDWHPPQSREELRAEATDLQLAAGRALGRYYVHETLWRFGQIVASMDHRNAHSSRVSDPGSRIHQGCTRPIAAEFGLECGSPVVGSGKPNPTLWSGAPGVPYNWRVRW